MMAPAASLDDPFRTLLPRLRHVSPGRGRLPFTDVVVDADEALAPAAARLAGLLGPSPAPVSGPRLRLVLGTPGSEAWDGATSAGLQPAQLPPEGYAVLVGDDGTCPRAVLAGADAAGVWHAVTTVAALLACDADGRRSLPRGALRDWPALPWRGVVEGFYGPPWTHEDRLDLLAFAGRHKLNGYLYAPKDDVFHRERWREPYPRSELDRIAELVAAATRDQVRFAYALAPGLSMRYADAEEHRLLLAKVLQLCEVGVREVALLFDDIPKGLADRGDVAAFGDGPGAAGAAHAHVCRQLVQGLAAAGGLVERVSICPTEYAGTLSSPYRERLAKELPQDVAVWWTGRDVVVGDVTRDEVDDAAAVYGHDLLLWDNFPVNDFDRSRLFLGPLTGRPRDVDGSALAGIGANPMIEAAPSHLALATVADYAWNPAGYDPVDAARRALVAVAAEDAVPLGPLVAACSGWPPSAPQSPELAEWTAAALRGDVDAAARAACAFADLAATARATYRRSRLVEQLDPFLRAAAATATAGQLALRLLRATQDGGHGPEDLAEQREALAAALAEVERQPADVLRAQVLALAAQVLAPEAEVLAPQSDST